MNSPKVRLAIKAGSQVVPLIVQGIPGIPDSAKRTLASDDGKWLLTLPPIAEFAWLAPGDMVVMTLSLVRASLEQVVPDALLPPQGLLIPGGKGN